MKKLYIVKPNHELNTDETYIFEFDIPEYFTPVNYLDYLTVSINLIVTERQKLALVANTKNESLKASTVNLLKANRVQVSEVER